MNGADFTMLLTSGKGIPLNAENLLEFVTNFRKFASFIEIVQSFEGAKGDLSFGFDDKNIWLWTGISRELADILEELIIGEKIGMCLCPVFVYLADGGMLNMPLAKRNMKYKAPRWCPVTFSAYDVVKKNKQLMKFKVSRVNTITNHWSGQ